MIETVHDEVRAIGRLSDARRRITEELGKVIVGQQAVIEQLLIALFAHGHCLLVGVPGLAKTRIIRSLAECLSLEFRRIQFTPDLMPSDITGTEVIQPDSSGSVRELRFLPGPIFGNIILADEINRTPPKTQSALLEAMQEHQITAGGERHAVPEPFFVLATQNPIEQEGTYPLPEAQLDRFMFQILMDYPDLEDELQMMLRTTAPDGVSLSRTLCGEDIMALGNIVRRVPVAEHVARYALQLVRHSRAQQADAPEFVRRYVQWGAGPRASQSLLLAGKSRAALQGRCHVTVDDIRHVAHPVLRHRIRTNFFADADGVNADTIVDQLIATVPDPAADAERATFLEVFRSTDTG